MATTPNDRTYAEPRVEERRRPETKTFIATSEFWVMAAIAAALLIVAYGFDDLRDSDSWRYITWLGIAYIVSRGLAKAGSQRNYDRRLDYDRGDVR